MTRKTRIQILVALSLVFLTGCGGGGGQATQGEGEIVIRALQYAPTNNTADDLAVFKEYVDRVNEAADGELKIDIIGGPEIVATSDQVSTVADGSLADMVMTFTVHGGIVPEINTAGLSEITPAEERENGYFDLLTEAHESKMGVTPLGRTATDSGFYIYSKERIESVAQMQRMDIRSHAGYDPFLKAIGANPIHVSDSEIYSALDQGVVEAAPYPLYVYDLGLAEVANYALEPGFWPSHTTYTYINTDFLNSLPTELQALLRDTAEELEGDLNQIIDPLAAEERQRLEDAGMEFTSLPEADAQKYIEASLESRFSELLDDGALSEDKVAEIRKLISK